MRDAIATLKVRFVSPDGAELPVSIQIGAPFQNAKRHWECEFDLQGIDGELSAMISNDSFSALAASLYRLRQRIEVYRGAGFRVLYPDVDQDLLLDCLFPPGLEDRSAKNG